MSTRGDRQRSRPEQPPLFETPAFDHTPTPPAEPPVLYGRPRLRTANRDKIVFRAAALDEIIPPDHPARVVSPLRVRNRKSGDGWRCRTGIVRFEWFEI